MTDPDTDGSLTRTARDYLVLAEEPTPPDLGAVRAAIGQGYATLAVAEAIDRLTAAIRERQT